MAQYKIIAAWCQSRHYASTVRIARIIPLELLFLANHLLFHMFHPFHMVHVYPKGSLIMEKDFYTIPEAAERCSVGRTTMWRWVKSGKMKANVTLGGQYRILKSDFEATLAENRSHSLSENGNTHPVEVSRNESFRGKTLIVDDDP